MLTFAAVLPAAFLLHYIYRHDTVEKEPVSLLSRILVFGMIATALLRLSLWIPAIAHGIYDYSLVSYWEYSGLFFLLFVVCVDVWAIRYIRRASAQDEAL